MVGRDARERHDVVHVDEAVTNLAVALSKAEPTYHALRAVSCQAQKAGAFDLAVGVVALGDLADEEPAVLLQLLAGVEQVRVV
jgi:hypothetical protein